MNMPITETLQVNSMWKERVKKTLTQAFSKSQYLYNWSEFDYCWPTGHCSLCKLDFDREAFLGSFLW